MKAIFFQQFRITAGAIVTLGLLVAGAASGQESTKPLPSKPQQVKPFPIAPVPPLNAEVHVLVLKHAKAVGVAQALRDLFPEKDGLTLRIAGVQDMNALLVRGSPEEVEKIYAVIDKLEKTAAEIKETERQRRNGN